MEVLNLWYRSQFTSVPHCRVLRSGPVSTRGKWITFSGSRSHHTSTITIYPYPLLARQTPWNFFASTLSSTRNQHGRRLRNARSFAAKCTRSEMSVCGFDNKSYLALLFFTANLCILAAALKWIFCGAWIKILNPILPLAQTCVFYFHGQNLNNPINRRQGWCRYVDSNHIVVLILLDTAFQSPYIELLQYQ